MLETCVPPGGRGIRSKHSQKDRNGSHAAPQRQQQAPALVEYCNSAETGMDCSKTFLWGVTCGVQVWSENPYLALGL